VRSLATPRAVRVVRPFSKLGEHGAIWIVGGILARRWRPTATVAASYALSTALKLVVRRRRPDSPLMATKTQLSFPSSHAVTSFAAVRAFRAPKLYALAVPLALSRLYLGVHYPSDIVAGAALGTLIGSAAR
jgi:undecaprenyl-diphosphatase